MQKDQDKIIFIKTWIVTLENYFKSTNNLNSLLAVGVDYNCIKNLPFHFHAYTINPPFPTPDWKKNEKFVDIKMSP